MDDTDLLRRVGAGDRAALKALYERHSDALHRFVRYRLRDPFEAGDVVQEVFLEIWRSAGRFEGRAAPRTWIFGIARNKAVDRMRGGDAAQLRSCLAKLSDSHRSAIHLAYYEELPYGEIAANEGVPVGTVKTRVMHAKRLLRHCQANARKP